MTVALAATFDPRGEIGRLQRLYPHLQAVYAKVVVSLPPWAKGEDVSAVEALSGIQVHVNDEWSHGRYMALKMALESDAEHLHYADMDRLLRWVETRPDEWRQTVSAIQDAECLIMGRSEQAYQTHPQALVQTEQISNRVVSALIGQTMDVSAGSKGFGRRAVECLMANTEPGRAMGTDGEWTVLLHRAGFRVDYRAVDGLDWESADRYQEQAADGARQRQMAAEYDADAQNWAARVQVALEITHAALDAAQRTLVGAKG
jgi:hypothetical protein